MLGGFAFSNVGFGSDFLGVVSVIVELHGDCDIAYCGSCVCRLCGKFVLGKCLSEQVWCSCSAESFEDEQCKAAVKVGHDKRGVVVDDLVVGGECFGDATTFSQCVGEV